jgi:hypothetical protein
MDPVTAPIPNADHRDIGGVHLDIVRVGNGRVGRVIYPAGFRWSRDMKPVVGTDFCEHVHIGLLVRGHIQGAYPDGCTFEYRAPAAVVLEPHHDAWVVGDEPAVLVQFDAEGDTARRFGLQGEHRHA